MMCKRQGKSPLKLDPSCFNSELFFVRTYSKVHRFPDMCTSMHPCVPAPIQASKQLYNPQHYPQSDSQMFDTVSGVLVFDHPSNGQVYHLAFYQTIHMPHLNHHLLCPMQCRVNDVIINDIPKSLTHFPTDTCICDKLPESSQRAHREFIYLSRKQSVK